MHHMHPGTHPARLQMDNVLLHSNSDMQQAPASLVIKVTNSLMVAGRRMRVHVGRSVLSSPLATVARYPLPRDMLSAAGS